MNGLEISVLDWIILLAMIAGLFTVWSLHEWIGAKIEEVEERTRKARLENDRIEIELQELRNKPKG